MGEAEPLCLLQPLSYEELYWELRQFCPAVLGGAPSASYGGVHEDVLWDVAVALLMEAASTSETSVDF
jgi:hypothetical protein